MTGSYRISVLHIRDDALRARFKIRIGDRSFRMLLSRSSNSYSSGFDIAAWVGERPTDMDLVELRLLIG
jgi:hypothetical protein